MAPEGLSAPGRPGQIRMILGTIGAGALLKSLEEQEFDAPRPRVTLYSRRSAALRALATSLATGDLEDAAAVRELADAAGRRTKELRRAAACIRADGLDAEDQNAHRAEQLLRAAATGRPLRPLTADEAAWFGRVDALAEAPLEEAFARLVTIEPALGLLEGEVRSASGTSAAAVDPDQIRLVLQGSSDPLVRTQAAWSVTRRHLASVADLASPDEVPKKKGFPGWSIPE